MRLLPLALLLAASPAMARPLSAGGQLGYALLSGAGATRHGALGGGHAWVGLTESLMLGGTASYAVLPGSGTAHVVTVLGGLLAKLDVVQWVPFATLEVGPIVHTLPDAGAAVELDVAFGAGVDYLWSREVAIGVHARYHLVATDVSRLPAFVTIGATLAYRWD